MESKVTNEEIIKAFIEKDNQLNEKYSLESLDFKSQVIILKYKIKEVTELVELLFNKQNVDKKEE